MQKPIKTCALVGRFQDARVAECAVPLISVLQSRQLKVLALQDSTAPSAPAGVAIVPLAQLIEQAELIIAIGGDGTLLYAAGLVAEHDIPLLGINRGRLGFLTDVLPQDMEGCIGAVLAGECEADSRPLLQARLRGSDGSEVQRFALNDVVFNRLETGRMLDFETRIDGRYVNSHGGDGLVVATATGSTAYALSCGGPIVNPKLNVLVVAPICPHTLSDRPIVVPGESRVDIRLIGETPTTAQVTCDAAVLGELKTGGRLEIFPAGRSVTLLHPPGYDYFRLLRSKLHWGLGGLTHER
ncbi:MAG TPA: NAD(+)/NADH kinase [Steroidobacteraceae bacterium]|jgi:NAD+ kinase|nr:NAD(+)/NADH kinase [Steroidobacteraceae bacterium]